MRKQMSRLLSGGMSVGKNRLLFALVMAFASLWAMPAQAVDYFSMCGQTVTDKNMNDLTVIPGVSGTVSYDPTTKTLRLKNAVIDTDADGGAIKAGESDYLTTIEVEGKCVINSTNDNAIWTLGTKLTIVGVSGTEQPLLIVQSHTNAAIRIKNEKHACTIRNLTLTATGRYGIVNFWSTGGTIAIENSSVYVQGQGTSGYEASLYGFEKAKLTGCELITPDGAAFDGGTVKKDGKLVTDEVVIAPSGTKYYGFSFCGVPVTDKNVGNLSSFPGVKSGTITYYQSSSPILQLNNVVMETAGSCLANNISTGTMIIQVGGKCSMTSTASLASFIVNAPTDIVGSQTNQSLTLSAPGSTGLLVNNRCSANNLELTATGQRGIAGTDYFAADRTLHINKSTVRAKGTKGSIRDLNKITYSSCGIVSPKGAMFTNGAVKIDDNVVTDEVVISPIYYVVKICGVQITDENKDDLTVIPGVSGTVSFKPGTKTLLLKDAVIETEGTGILNESADGLNIEVQGDCKINAGDDCISLELPGNIKGTSSTNMGSLTLNSAKASALLVNTSPDAFGWSATISDLNLTVTGKYGIAGKNGNTNIGGLQISHSYVRAKGTSGSIINFESVDLTRCELLKPDGAAFDGGTLKKNGSVVTDEAFISTYDLYGLYVCGTEVTSKNKDNLASVSSAIEKGEIRYIPETKTLRLNGVVMDRTNYCIKNSGVDSLTIEVQGDCELKSSDDDCIVLNKPTTITASDCTKDSLKLSCADDYRCSALWANAPLTLTNLNLTAIGENYAISSGPYAYYPLVIENSTIRAKGVNGAIYSFKTVTLKDCEIITPEGAVFFNGTLWFHGTVTDALITPKSVVGIDEATSNTHSHEGIYTLDGVRLNTTFDKLPRGIYIVDGKKIFKK